MSQTTMGPKGGHRPNTAISGGAIVYGTAIKRGADLNHAVQATANSLNLGIATDDVPTAERAFGFVDQAGEINEGRAGAAFALDAYLASDANGKLVTATTGQNAIARAKQAATAADQLVPVQLLQAGFLAP
jgi:hypothetical protein